MTLNVTLSNASATLPVKSSPAAESPIAIKNVLGFASSGGSGMHDGKSGVTPA